MSDFRPAFSYNIPFTTALTVFARVTPFPTQRVRIATTAACYVMWGSAAQCALLTTANGMLLQPSIAGETYGIGNGEQVAVIAASGSGSVNVSEMTQ